MKHYGSTAPQTACAGYRMYNAHMPGTSYEIRVCESCGLRYPLIADHPFGSRCPVCMGDTSPVLSRQLAREAAPVARVTVESGRRLAVLLDNIRSAWNVGSILRSADGFGFSHAYLCGITPTAHDESVKKTSLGAELSVSWSYHRDAVQLVEGLKAEGWKVVGLEEHPGALPLGGRSPKTAQGLEAHENEVLVLGNELTGVDPGLLALCDEIYYIPMRGEKKSFNVAIAFGIAAYVWTEASPLR